MSSDYARVFPGVFSDTMEEGSRREHSGPLPIIGILHAY